MNTLKLNKLANNQLSKKEMTKVVGGECQCGCGCMYANSGGASINANANANKAGGKFSQYNVRAYCDGVWVVDFDFD